MDMLSKIVHPIISPNQSAFIKGRYIMKGMVVLHEALNSIHDRKQSALLFKVILRRCMTKIKWWMDIRGALGKKDKISYEQCFLLKFFWDPIFFWLRASQMFIHHEILHAQNIFNANFLYIFVRFYYYFRIHCSHQVHWAPNRRLLIEWLILWISWSQPSWWRRRKESSGKFYYLSH